jgi:hypothetical protein
VFGPRTQPTPPPPPAVQPPDPPPNGTNPSASPSILQLPSLPEPSASPLKNVDAVKTYLEQNGSRALNPVEIAGLVSMLQDSIDNIDGAHDSLRLVLLPRFNHTFCSSQMTPNSHSVFRKAHHAQVLQRPTRSLLTRQPRPKRQLGPCPRTRMERTSGKVLEVHVATGIIHPPSDHLALGTRLSFSPRRRQRVIRSGDALAGMQKLHLHKRPLLAVSRPLNPLPLVPLHLT